MSVSLILQITLFAFTLWLGLYLIARDRDKPVLLFTGLGLVAYALGLALDSLSAFAADTTLLERVRWPLWFAPALLWYAASAHILPESRRRRCRLLRCSTGRTELRMFGH